MLQKVGNLSVAVSFICPETDVKSVGLQGTLGRRGKVNEITFRKWGSDCIGQLLRIASFATEHNGIFH